MILSQPTNLISSAVAGLLPADKLSSDVSGRRPATLDLAQLLYQTLTSTKFRKSAMDESTSEGLKTYLNRTVSNGQRLRLYFCFGGYKQSRLSSAPEPDWAEIFTISFSLEAATAVAQLYPPGVDIIYRADEVVVTLLDNYRRSARITYTQGFNRYLDLFRSHLRAHNLSLTYELTSETSPEAKLFPLMKKLFPKHEQAFKLLPPEVQDQKIMRSYRNQTWDGELDLTHLSEAEKRDRAKWAFIMHDAFLEADFALAADFFDNGVSISYRRGVPGTIHYGSCSSSSVQFWAGQGLINVRDQRAIPWILSYEQLQNVAPQLVALSGNPFSPLGLTSIPVLEDYA